MQQYAEKERLKFQPPQIILTVSELSNGTIVTPLLLFY